MSWTNLAGKIGAKAAGAIIEIIKVSSKGTPPALDEFLKSDYDKMTGSDVVESLSSILTEWRDKTGTQSLEEEKWLQEYNEWQKFVDNSNKPNLGDGPSKFHSLLPSLAQIQNAVDNLDPKPTSIDATQDPPKKRMKCMICDETSCSVPTYTPYPVAVSEEVVVTKEPTTEINTSKYQPLPILEEQQLLHEQILKEEDRRKKVLLNENEAAYLNRERKYTEIDIDPNVRPHAIHWLVCMETYEENRQIFLGDGLKWALIHDEPETCVYRSDDTIIAGFRGTKAFKDLYDDAKLSFGQVFTRGTTAVTFMKGLLSENQNFKIEVTGHSLGGAIARVVCEDLGLSAITFNAAAPPTSPVSVCPKSVNYHIVFDVISAWQSPHTVRIHKGFQPIASPFARLSLALWLYLSFTDIIDSHHLYHFSNEINGVITTAEEENKLMKDWWKSLPPILSWNGVLGSLVSGLLSLPTIK